MDSFYEDHRCLKWRIELFRTNLHFLVLVNRGDFSNQETIQLSQDLDELLVIFTRQMEQPEQGFDSIRY